MGSPLAIEQVSHKFHNNTITHILGGDFNTGGNDWDVRQSSYLTQTRGQSTSGCSTSTKCIAAPTQESNLLELFFTTKPVLVKSSISIPGVSDHETVLTDCSMKPLINKQQPCRIHLWKRADWNKLKTEAVKFKESFPSSAGSRSVSENFDSLKLFLDKLMAKHAPKRLLRRNTKHLPWITQAIRRMCKRKQRLFGKAKHSHKSRDWLEYKNTIKETLCTIQRVHWNYRDKNPT